MNRSKCPATRLQIERMVFRLQTAISIQLEYGNHCHDEAISADEIELALALAEANELLLDACHRLLRVIPAGSEARDWRYML